MVGGWAPAQRSRGHRSSRTGCALPAAGSATAATAGSGTAAVPQGSSSTWPSSTATITLRNTWRGECPTTEAEIPAPAEA